MSASLRPGAVACGVGSREPPGQLDRQTDTPLSISLHPSLSLSCASLGPSGLYIRSHIPPPPSFYLACNFALFPRSLSSHSVDLKLVSLSVRLRLHCYCSGTITKLTKEAAYYTDLEQDVLILVADLRVKRTFHSNLRVPLPCRS